MRFLLASLLYIGCILIFFHPNLLTLTEHLIGPPEDNMQDLWNVWYSQQLDSFDMTDWVFTRLLFFPEGISLLYHSFSYPNLFVIRLIRTVFQLPPSLPVLVGLHNGALLVSFLFGGVAAYYLAYYFTRQFWTAWIGGFIFAFSPFHFAHSLHHMGVATIQFIPCFVLCVLRLEETQRVYYGIGAVIWFVLGALSSWYFLFYNLFFIVFLYLSRAIPARKLIIKPLLSQSSAIVAGCCVVLSPLLVSMVREAAANPNAYADGHNVFVADVLGLFIFHPYHWAADWVENINGSLSGNPWEMSVYLGIVNVALLLWAVVKRYHRTDPVLRWCLWGMLFFLMFAGGSYLHVYGVSLKPIALPTKFLEYLPFFGNLRTPSRAIVYTYLFLGIGVARILGTLQLGYPFRAGERLASSGFVVGKAAIFVALVLDFCSVNRDSTPVTCPAAYAAIGDSDTSSFGILDLPMRANGNINLFKNGNRYMMYQLCHGRPIVHATISRKLTKTLNDRLVRVDVNEYKDLLQRNQVKYIVFHKQLMTSATDLVRYEQQFRAVYRDADQVVFQVY